MFVVVYLITLLAGGGSGRPSAEELERKVADACTARAVEAAPANGITWDGVPVEPVPVQEIDDESKRGADKVWYASGKIPAGAAPWTESMTFYRCTLYTSKSGTVEEIRDFKIFG